MKKKLFSLFLILSLLLCGCAEAPQPTAATVPPSGDGLMVHFVDVGQADCILIECGS